MFMSKFTKMFIASLCILFSACSLETKTTTIKYLCRHYAIAKVSVEEDDVEGNDFSLSSYVSMNKNESYAKFGFDGNYEIKITYLRLDEDNSMISTVENGTYHVGSNNKIYLTTSDGEEKEGDDLYTKVYYLRVPTILVIEGEANLYHVWFSGNPTDPNITCPVPQ